MKSPHFPSRLTSSITSCITNQHIPICKRKKYVRVPKEANHDRPS